MRRILLTGSNGQIGWELQRTLATLGEIVALDRTGMDLANPDAIRSAVREIKPALIVNAAAYTAVDKAESEPELAMTINGVAPGILAEEAKRVKAALIHYSTDYVFDGTKDGPYTENDVPNPLNIYGKTKLAGERAIQEVGAPHLIFRTSWVYGTRGKNFLLTILRLARERDDLRVVDDQIGAPTWSRMIAEATSQILAKLPFSSETASIEGVKGIFNLTNTGETSWFGFAKVILERAPRNAARSSPKLVPIPTREYPTPAIRPKNSRLDNAKLMTQFGLALSRWDRGVALCLEELAC